MVFSGLSPLVIEEVTGEEDRIVVRARTPGGPVACPGCGARTVRVHAYDVRTLADVPLDARRVSVLVQIRRLACRAVECPRQTFRELAGLAGARVLSALAMGISRHTAVRVLLRLPLPEIRTPRGCLNDVVREPLLDHVPPEGTLIYRLTCTLT